MTHRLLLLLVVLGLLSGCHDGGGGSGDDGGTGGDGGVRDDADRPPIDGPVVVVGSFDEELPAFRKAFCDRAVTCIGQDRAMCETEVNADMADAKAALDAAGEMRCARCMHVKATEIAKVVAANCNAAAGDAEAIFAACDLDRTVDYDGDDNPGNDDDEACAGFP
ncbi:MAG TPA: hypothetical protein VK932_21335 [Kofleriaceae bacterium]|nr:hypothetical protein [Kofleriaceae bacterium]